MDSIELPAWARVLDSRSRHIRRVTLLLLRWAGELSIASEETRAWRDAGLWHDALRDAPEAELREIILDDSLPAALLHGPAAAAVLERHGERRAPVLDAVRWHTVGHPDWDRTGRALFMADYLDPGRPFARASRAALADQVAHDFDGVFRQVLRSRLERVLIEGQPLRRETVALWNRMQ
ncbi:MAG: HD domain-containing protein [Gemmatimonadaceae bacterium]